MPYKRLFILYHRCILSYLWFYCEMRQYKFAWLRKMVYRMPRIERESDFCNQFSQIPGSKSALPTQAMYRGQFGKLGDGRC